MQITYKTFWADKEKTVSNEVIFTGTNPTGSRKYYRAVDDSRGYEISDSRHANHWWDDMITINKKGVSKAVGYAAKVS